MNIEKKKKYKYALFDWDGCLSNTLENAKRIHLKLAKQKGVDLSEHDLRKLYGDWEKATNMSGYTSVDEFKNDYSQMVRDSILGVELNDGARELLQLLKQHRIPVGIVTTSSREYILKQAEKDGIQDMFDFLIGFEDVTKTKPDPEPVLKMLEVMGANDEESIMIGDTEKDIVAAQETGIDSILFRPEQNRLFYGSDKPISVEPTYQVETLIEIQEYFI